MTAEQRRQEILTLLEQTDTPLSAAALAHRFSVSRQIVVGDVALLRAQGREIVATARGYVIPAPAGACAAGGLPPHGGADARGTRRDGRLPAAR